MQVDLDKLTLGAVTGAITNAIIGGIGARLAMRVVVLLIGGRPSVTVEGTLGIVVLAALLGLVLGVMVAGAHTLAGMRWRRADWLLGTTLALLVSGFFFSIREGEVALLPASQGVLLFAPLALASTLATGALYARVRQRITLGAPRRVPGAWLVAYGAAFALAFGGMISLAGGPLRLPRVAWHLALRGASADFAAAYAPMQALGFFFILVYLLLTWILFWRATKAELRAGATGCLLLAAGLFHVQGPLENLWGRGLLADVLEGVLALIGAGILAVVYWRLFQRSPAAVRRTPLVVSLAAAATLLLGLLLLIATQGTWGILRQPPQATLFSVTLYLLPWLALPLGLLGSMRARPTPAGKAAMYPAAVYPDAVPADVG